MRLYLKKGATFVFAMIRYALLFALLFTGTMACRNRDAVPLVDFTIDLNQPDYQDLQLFGGQKLVNNILLFRDGLGNYHAVSGYCSYDQCTLEYQVSPDYITCPCHTCRYTDDGAVTTGPATIALTKYLTTLNGTYLRVYSVQ